MNTTNQILLVVNPISGDINKDNIIAKVKKEAKIINTHVEVYATRGKNDKENIQQLLKENDFGKLLIVGGDGSIKLGVAALIDSNTTIPLGIIPAGSANGMAVELDLPLDINKAIQFALKNEAKPVDIIKINGEAAIHISDIGINAALVKNYDQGNIRGKLGYALQSIPTLINFKEPFEYDIDINGDIFSGEAIMIAVANAKKYGNGAIINPKGKLDDGKFEILIFKSLQITQIFETIFNEIPPNEDFVKIISTEKATISTKKAVPFQIDGEYCNKTNLITVEISDKKVIIIH